MRALLIHPGPHHVNLDPLANESLRQRGVPTLSLVTEPDPLEVAAWRMAEDSHPMICPRSRPRRLSGASIVLPFVFSPGKHGGTSETRRTCSALPWTNSASNFPTLIARSGT
jgi:hypothetical protein